MYPSFIFWYIAIPVLVRQDDLKIQNYCLHHKGETGKGLDCAHSLVLNNGAPNSWASSIMRVHTCITFAEAIGALLFNGAGGKIPALSSQTLSSHVKSTQMSWYYLFLERYPDIPPEKVYELIREVVKACQAGIQTVGDVNASTEATNWDLPSSIFFASTVITTIGESSIQNL